MDPAWARDNLQPICAVQGNLDPSLMVGDGAELAGQIDHLIECLGNGPYIFNLGHGITPEVNPDHVSHFDEAVHEYSEQYHK